MKFKVGDRVIAIAEIDGNTSIINMSAVVELVEDFGVTLLFDGEPKFAWGRLNRNWFCPTRHLGNLKVISKKEFTDAEYEELLV